VQASKAGGVEDYTMGDFFGCVEYWVLIDRRLAGMPADWYTVIYTAFLAQYDIRGNRRTVYKYMYNGEPISKSQFFVGYLSYIYSEVEDEVDPADIHMRTCRDVPKKVEERISNTAYRYRNVDMWNYIYRLLFNRDRKELEKHAGMPIETLLRKKGYIIVHHQL